MNLREAMLGVAEGIAAAKQGPLRENPLARFIRVELPELIKAAFCPDDPYSRVQSTKNVGSWATIQWISKADDRMSALCTRPPAWRVGSLPARLRLPLAS